MKKFILGLILTFVFLVCGINGVKAEEKNIEITEVKVEEKSENTFSEISEFSNSNLNMDLKLYDENDYITYKLVLKNISNRDYIIKNITDNNDNNNITITYKTSSNEIKKSEEFELFVTIKYTNKIKDKSLKFDKNLQIKLNYDDGQSSTLSVNPETNDNILKYVLLSAISLISLIILIIGNKKKKFISFIAITMILIPTVYAVTMSLDVNLDMNLVLYDGSKATFKTGKEVNLKMLKLAGAPEDISFVKNEYTNNYEICSNSNGCYNDFNILYFKSATDEQYDDIKGNLTEDNIVSLDESDKPIYMWFESMGEYWRNYDQQDNTWKMVKKGENGDNGYQTYYEVGTIYWYSEASLIYLNSDSSYMFSRLYSLTDLDLSEFKTSLVSDVSNMFYYSSLKNINLSSFDLTKVDKMNDLFSRKNNVTNLTINNLETMYLKERYENYYYFGVIIYDKDMTWEEWLESKYNFYNLGYNEKYGIYVDEDHYGCGITGHDSTLYNYRVIYNGDEPVKLTDKITNTNKYDVVYVGQGMC